MSISLLKISCPDVSETNDVALLIPPPCISRMLNMCTNPQSNFVELVDWETMREEGERCNNHMVYCQHRVGTEVGIAECLVIDREMLSTISPSDMEATKQKTA